MKNSFYDSLSKKYREKGRGALSQGECEAYLTARFPATFSAVQKVLCEVKNRMAFSPSSLLDLGAGPGTGTLASSEIFPTINKVTLIEKNRQMITQGKRLCEGEWLEQDLCKARFSSHDLVLFAYSFGEVEEKQREDVLRRAWEAARVLIIVEPGTPRGFEHVLKARLLLLEWGGHMVAPCPHAGTCPMKGAKWCHFSVRLERSRAHRQMKGGALGFEDEKFSYLCVAKNPIPLPEDRIIGLPRKENGGIRLELCKRGTFVASKKVKPLYKKLKWGDSLLFEPIVEKGDQDSEQKSVGKAPDSSNNPSNE